MGDFLISVVLPVYNEEKQIQESIKVIHKILKDKDINHEFVLVDDGSRDNTWKAIKEASAKFPRIRAVKFSRNFGKEAALCAGLEAATGDACIVLDADLQHPPEIIPEMVRLWREEGYEVVEGVKTSRGNESFTNKVAALMFYKVMHKLSGLDLNGASDFKLMDAKVIAAWKMLNERNTFFRGMTAWVGFKRIEIPFMVVDRARGKSKWSILRLFKLAVTAITSFSSLPLQVVTFLGVAFLICSIPMAVETLYLKFRGEAVSGFTTVILLLLIIGSALMISLGIIGTYIAKIFDEVKYRPRYLVAETLGNDNDVKK